MSQINHHIDVKLRLSTEEYAHLLQLALDEGWDVSRAVSTIIREWYAAYQETLEPQ